MIVDRIVCGKYGCADPNTRKFIAGYTRDEIRKKDIHILNKTFGEEQKTSM